VTDFIFLIHTHIKMNLFYLKTQFVPRSKHTVSVIKTSPLMLYREIIAVCSEIHTEHINTLCGQNVKVVNDKVSVTNIYH
jgi:hypothetical protein